jgi:hypothetical protein
VTQVINVHHYGGVDKLPPGSVYIGRPSSHGNPYSMESGKFSREECVAFHRIDLYEQLTRDNKYLSKLKAELEGKLLGCWCKNPKHEIACHGDNFVHIFKDINKDRDYSKTVLFYLLDDLRKSLTILRDWVIKDPSQSEFVNLYFEVYDAKTEIEFLFTIASAKKPDPDALVEWIAKIAIELELAVANKDLTVRSYWLKHCVWTICKILHPDSPGEEPVLGEVPVKRKRKA